MSIGRFKEDNEPGTPPSGCVFWWFDAGDQVLKYKLDDASVHVFDGTDGNTILYGTAAPTTEGVNGDFYIRTTTNFIYGPKAAGTWPAGTSLIGPAGANGTNGTDGNTILYGTAAPTTEGVDGDFYIRTTTNFIYGPKAAGTWPSGTSLVGPTGATGATGASGASYLEGDGAYFFTQTASDQGGGRYEMTKGVPAGGGFGIANAGVLNGDTLAAFASITGYPNATYLPSGVLSYFVQARQTAGTQISKLYAEFYTRTVPGGTNTLIATTPVSIALTGSNAEISGTVICPVVNGLNLTDRLLVVIKADISGVGTAPDITIDIQGANFSRARAPFEASLSIADTDSLPEGATNLYFTDARAVTALAGTIGKMAGYDGAGELYSIPSLDINTTSNGIFQFLTIEPNANSGGFQVNETAVQFDPQANSPNESWNVFNHNIQLDINSSGFTQGTAGLCSTIINQGFTHQGTGDVGQLNGIMQNFQLGNGTDPIDIKGVGYVFGFGNFAAGVNVSGPVQGYGFQPTFNASATVGSTQYMNGFYDFTNAPIALPTYQSFTTTPIIGSINNNSNHVSYNSAPTITTLTGNAGYFALASSPTITNVNTGSVTGFNFNPTVTLNKGNAYGVNVNMGGITNYAGVQASIVVQDITYTFIQAGSYNNIYTIEYADTVTAGSENVTILGNAITVNIESGVSTATQVKAACDAVPAFISAVSNSITGTPSDPQVAAAATNFAGGIDPGTRKAALFQGDVEIQGGLSFTGGLTLAAINSFAPYTVTSGLGVASVDTLITAPDVPANATITGTDLLAINTAMLMTIGTNATVTSSFLGYAALGLPAVLSMGTGSTIDQVSGATFAISLDAGAAGGTVANVDLCRALAIPNGVTTLTQLSGYKFELPFGDPGTTTWGFYSAPTSAHNYFAGDVVVGTSDTPTNSSVGIELNSTTQAILNARMTTTQRNALTAVNGMQIYNTTDDKLQVYAAGSWVDLH